jgi:hypothetical protein
MTSTRLHCTGKEGYSDIALHGTSGPLKTMLTLCQTTFHVYRLISFHADSVLSGACDAMPGASACFGVAARRLPRTAVRSGAPSGAGHPSQPQEQRGRRCLMTTEHTQVRGWISHINSMGQSAETSARAHGACVERAVRYSREAPNPVNAD